MNLKRKKQKSERVRNVLMILFALGVVVIFFNLDVMRKGESVFSRTADKKLRFTGDLKREAYSKSEVDRLVKYIKRYNDLIDTATVETTLQDPYKKVTGKSQMIFEVHLVMMDGTTISTPTRRITRTRLVDDILAKMSKDIRAYRKLLKDGKKVKSLVNTM
ncbi:hypothetical protein [Pseudodesulfovibrio sp. zrk46]|uniref:hypothetical protein n=1 Tax=Pseudodesulfovibrio sp. zrk46 TaxID=2725288 RepID=UPI0014496F99|nr:hypothetical protein [Pseudodesulfovibrio sp. zrk46]QJB55758.1 hypothetical protein HFN16_04780 [Pseudodesulfovibrio sp. zrk46]